MLEHMFILHLEIIHVLFYLLSLHDFCIAQFCTELIFLLWAFKMFVLHWHCGKMQPVFSSLFKTLKCMVENKFQNGLYGYWILNSLQIHSCLLSASTVRITEQHHISTWTSQEWLRGSSWYLWINLLYCEWRKTQTSFIISMYFVRWWNSRWLSSLSAMKKITEVRMCFIC